ncbi:hypothetical protein Aph01nite_54400 [Acrocarpospora phusangensis]|uniref:DUF998 domain-containing protein n=1 Tax=Acrocarpospora phusangensis TaxID=1070424 RepID=A0A919QIT2_9ACTN|nr:DUF998 domain-containing protein [Acrocarpospora phusangensis]GIH27130.1 hypothetical protein Aph01nite_54400 [Acrocarpospora phusangensis]
MSTRTLLTCGIIAGPLFVTTCLIQAVTREGYDLSRHPISLLSLGEAGWIQIANFVVTGLLYVACAAGLRRTAGGTWGPLLVGLLGAGLIVGGVFLTDAGAGFPAGAPEGAPELTWHGIIHTLGPVVALGSIVVAGPVYLRRFAREGNRGWATGSALASAMIVALLAWPDPDGLSVRLLAATAVACAFVAAVSWRAVDVVG